MEKTFEIETSRFGVVKVKKDDVITFPDGPLGFPDCNEFVFIDEPRMAPFRCLQSLDNPSLAFVVVDPRMCRKEYKIDMTLEDLIPIEATSTEGLEIYSVVTMARNIHDVTINMQGPFIINTIKKLAYQYIFHNSEYTTREKFLQPLT